MTAWHRARETWSTVDEDDIDFVVHDRLPDLSLIHI